MDRNELFRIQKLEHDRERELRLKMAMTRALSEGKEPFDLELMDELWRDNPDRRSEALGIHLSKDKRTADWSEIYYVQYPKIRTMKEFVAKMIEAQVNGFFD